MPGQPPTPKNAARPLDVDRTRVEKAGELYLQKCYSTGEVASAGGFARYLRVARPYLSRRVAELFGVSLRDFLRERQLARAQHLLRAAGATTSIEQVAIASAFGSTWTFQRCFKAAFGITPAAFRKQVTK